MTQKELRLLIRSMLNEENSLKKVTPIRDIRINENKIVKITDKETQQAYVTSTNNGIQADPKKYEVEPLQQNEGSAVEGELYSYFERVGDIIEELGKALELGGNDPDFAVTMVLDYIKKTYQPNA